MGESTSLPADNLPRESATPIARKGLHEEVAARLRDMIVEGELEPGARVPERELCLRFGISRTPLREALKILASESLIDLQHHRGAVVSSLTAAALDDLFQVMGALEALAGRAACERASDAAIGEIRALHERMLGHYARGELSDYFRLNQRIHEGIVAAAGNPVLSQLYRGLSVRIRRARYMANLSKPRWDQAVAEHRQILEALTARDGARLGRLLEEHLRHKLDVLKTVILNPHQGRSD
jgi:DNA-binding GntR family transcriptional regulator